MLERVTLNVTLQSHRSPTFMDCIINRRARFSASHRYYLPEWDEAENQRRFGLGSRFPGHGHNYELYVSLHKELNLYGMV
ncbi:MAG: 6-carboxytetrahydropterin synthase, partial [Microcystis panniformis]